MSCEYEKIRLRNIEDNKRILKELGLLNPFNPLPRVIKKAPKRKRARSPDAQPAKKAREDEPGETGSVVDESPATRGRRRRSARIRGIDVNKAEEIVSDAEEENEDTPKRKFPKDRPQLYGAIPGVEVGTVWQMRSDCSYDGVHRPWVAGIHGGPDGAWSIALSGGYEDDIDMGDCFTYTGEGGRDLKGTKANPKNLRTAPQSKDQSLTKGNLALVKSCETGNPIRVIRGYKCRGPFAPEDGYRYDGLYKVEKYWFTTGTSGFGVYKFAFRRLENQAPPPWTFEGVDANNNDDKASEDDEDKKVAAELEGLSVEEKLRRMLERDGLTYKPSETKTTESESESEEMEDDGKETEESSKMKADNGTESMEDGKETKEKEPEENSSKMKADNGTEGMEEDEKETEGESSKMKADNGTEGGKETKEKSSKAGENEDENETKDEDKIYVKPSYQEKCEAECDKAVTEIGQEVSEETKIESKETEVKEDTKEDAETSEKKEEGTAETKETETEVKENTKIENETNEKKEEVNKSSESKIKTEADTKSDDIEEKADVDVEAESDTESETNDNTSENSSKETSEDKNNDTENIDNKTGSDSEDVCSQDSGFLSQENISTGTETTCGTSKSEPLKEMSSTNTIDKKDSDKAEAKTPKAQKKGSKPKTPKSETSTPKQKDSVKKAKSTTPKTTPKGKQLTMMDMFKPKPKA